MIPKNIQAIVLAAGKSTRFRTGKTKLLEKICGQEMILYPTRLLEAMNIPTTLVVGYQKELVQETVKEHHRDTVQFVTQEVQRGTGHAILTTKETWNQENILIFNGDCPLVTQDIIEALYTEHINTHATISFVVAHNADPTLTGYGRLVQDADSMKIVEAKDFTGDSNTHCCVNAGIYLVKREFLAACIAQIGTNNKSNEFYFTDIIEIASTNKLKISTITAPFDRIRGINTLQELWVAEQIKRAELIKYWMEHGVHFTLAQNVHIDLTVSIDSGVRIGCGVLLLGNTKIGKNSIIDAFSSLEDSVVGDNAAIYSHCILKNVIVENGAQVGPFAHLRNNAHIGKDAVIGNFVEVKNSTVGTASKAKHLTYLGDAQIGSHVNIGAGTITCNYDGSTTNQTIIKNNVFVGSNSSLVAPVTIESNTIIGAGSTITHHVPEHSLAIARARQINKEGYLKKNAGEQSEKEHAVTENPEPALSFSGATAAKSMNTTDTLC